MLKTALYFSQKRVWNRVMKDDRMSATPGYFSLRFKFHVDSDSVSDSSLNSVGLRKSFNHSNCIKPADAAKKDIHLHYCALHSVWFLLRFGNAYAQEKSQKIVILYALRLLFESETIKSRGLISYRSSKERFQALFPREIFA